MRIIFFVSVLVLALSTPFWLFYIGAFFYAMRYSAYELIVLGVCIDAQFGSASQVFFGALYSSVMIATVFVVEFLKPHMSLYDRET